ncbi:uncharacterized protein [Typha latifolia]|uniref:uncharacterized protein n=1 Tax=Typha latifolia TaxID=4733 RepID=UPI003C2B1B39
MEPDVAEFVSALAAGSGARLMVEACSETAGPVTLAIIAAANQTAGRAVCIVRGADELQSSVEFLGPEAENVELVVGNARELLRSEYSGADFVIVDCEMGEYEQMFKVAHAGAVQACGGLVVGYNAFSLQSSGAKMRAEYLPIGGGLMVCRVPAGRKRSQWIVQVDEETGEEHVFRITSPSPRGKRIY